jgi:hypothetical protein
MSPEVVLQPERRGPSRRVFGGSFSHRSRKTLRLAAAAAASLVGARFAQASPNVITPDGSTRTELQVSGSVTNITTQTIAGPDAFNSFSSFEVGSGNTVNLEVPNSADYLVNLVHDSPVLINGILNAYKNGQIGGNIVFADPDGMIVGASGVINAGALTVTTPTPAFLNTLLSQAGKVDPQAAQELIVGDEPLATGAVISLAGRINALTSVNLQAAEVISAKSSVLTVGDAAKLQDALFKATVNTSGLQEATGLTESNGTIAIVASTGVDLAGDMHAGGQQGGSISVTAPTVAVESSAHIDASGPNGGGSIYLGGNFHGDGPLQDAQQVAVASGAQITANATSDGDGGNVALWSTNGTDFAGDIQALGGPLGGNGGYVEVSAKVGLNFVGQVSTSAPNGQTGTLLLDPTDLYIINGSGGNDDGDISGGTLSFTTDASDTDSTISVGELQSLGDTNITLEASDAITIGNSSGGATNLNLSSTLKTKTLTLEAGSNANDSSSYAGNIIFNSGSTIETDGGNVVLDAGAGFSGSGTYGSGTIGTATLGSITTHGGGVTVNAADGISVPAGTTINTTGTGTPGAIDFVVGQQLNAGIDVDLSQTIAITIDGTLNGGTITLDNNSLTNSVYNNNATDIAEFAASTTIGNILGLAGEGVLAQDSSTISINSTATITGTDVTIESQTSEEADSPEYNLGLGINPFPSTVLYGEVDATSAATISKGATININSGGSLTVSATNNDTLDISADTVTTSAGSYTAVTVAVGEADINSSATIASGANINLSSNANVSVTALNQNSFYVSATALANSKGVVGIAAAVSDITTNATADEDASLGTSSNKAGNVTVVGDNITTEEVTKASSSAGSSAVMSAVLSATSGVTSALGGAMSSFFGSTGGQGGGSSTTGSNTTPFRVGAAMGLSLISQGSYAQIANDDGVSADTPTIDSSGDVLVHAVTSTAGIRSDGQSSVSSQTSENGGSPTNPSNQTGVSVGVAVGIYHQTTHADVGDNVKVTAANVGVSALSNIPATITWLQWDSFSDVISHLNGNLGTANDVLTSYANATGSATNLSIAGAVNFFDVYNNTQAWIGTGAQVTSTATGESSSVSGSTDNAAWTVPLTWDENALDYDLDTQSNTTLNFNDPVTVSAYNFTQTIDMGGNFSISLNGSKAGSGGTSVGGAFNGILYSNTTDAAIGSDAVVTADNSGPGLSVTAQGVDQVLAIAPTSGGGSSVAGNGIFGFLDIENSTQASISNAADVIADQVVVDGEEDLSLWNVAGAASEGNTAGVGIGLAISYFDTETDAFIGDNTDLTLGGAALGGTSGGGYVHAGQLSVDALTDGQAGSLAVAGAATSSSDPNAQPGNLSQAKSWAQGKMTSLQLSAASAFGKIPGIGSKIASAVGPAVTVDEEPPDPETSTAVAGSSTVNVSLINTKAWISGATLAGKSGTAIDPTVQALNYTGLISASGGASLAMASNPSVESSAGIAGAIALNVIDNTTTAYIDDSDLTDVNALNVNAIVGGFEVTVGLGLAVNTSSSEDNVAFAGSISIPVDTNTVSAYVQNSTVTGLSSDTDNSINVTAYDQTLIGVGGGSFYGTSGEGGGAGVVVTVSSISNTVSAYLDGVDATQFDTVDVQALDASQIYGGALMIGGAPSGIAIDGGFVINFITDQTSASIDAYIPSSGPAVDSTIDTTGNVTVNAESSSDLATSDFTSSDYYYQLDPTLGEGAIGILQGSSSPTYSSLLSQFGGGNPTDSNVNISSSIGGETLPSSTQNEIIGVAGFGSGGEDAVGIGFIANVIDNSYTASIDNATVDATGGTVNVTATNDSTIIGVALGVAVATDGVSGLGSVVGNYMGETTSATIGDPDGTGSSSYANVTGTAVNVTSNNNATIWSGAGSIGYGSEAAFGASIAYNQTNDSSTAQIESATADALSNGTVQVNSMSASDINSYAIAGGFAAEGPAVEGAVSVDLTTDGTIAQIDNSTIDAGTLSDEASDPDAAILSETGTVAAGEVSVGASIGIDMIDNTLQGDITGSTLNVTDDTTAEADSGGSIQSLDYAGGVGDEIAVGFANSSNNIGNTVSAYIIDSSGTEADNTTDITAEDTSTIETLAAGITGGGDVGASIATAINRISTNVNAYVQGASGETTPTIADPTLTEDDVVLDASSNATISSLAAGFAFGGEGGGVGSIAINILTNTVNAYIDDGTQVTALDNVGVEATNQNAIQDVAGALAISASVVAAGLSTGVNYIGSGTYAYISGTNTDVNALASDSSDTLNVQNGGTLTNGSGFQANITTLSSLADYNAPTPSENSITVTGLAVNAASLNTVSQVVFAGSFSFDPAGSAALSAVVGVSVAGGTTSADIDDAGINQTQSVVVDSDTYNAGSDQEVNVTASNHDLGALFAIGTAAGVTDFAGAATVGVQSFSGDTNAYITGSDVNADDSLTIESESTQDGAALSAGLAAAIVGGAATAVVDDFSADTQSYLVGGTIDIGALTINANTEDSAETAGGSLAFGGVAVGATILVVQSDDTTKSYMGDASDQTATTLTTSGAVNITAESKTNLNAISVTGGVGGYAFVVMASVNLIDNITDADMYDTSIDQQVGNPDAASVNINATDNMTLNSYAGALSAGESAGVGAGVNVLDITSQVGAGSYGNSMNVSGALTVNAMSTKDLEAVTAVASIGGSAGLAGAAGVVIISAQSSDGSYGELANVQSNDNSTLADISTLFGSGNYLLANTNNQLTSTDMTNIGNETTTNLALWGGMGNGTKAILAGGTINAGSVAVLATDNTAVKNIAAAGGLGGAVGVGAGIGVTELDGTVFASIQNAWITSATTAVTTNITSPTITVTATEAPLSGDTTAVTDAYAGGAGVGAGFGAAVAVSLDDTDVTANAGGTLTGNNGSGSYLDISASDSSTLSGDTVGVAAGIAGAAGASVTYVKKTSTVGTYILPPTAAIPSVPADPPLPAIPGVPATPSADITDFNSVTLTSTDSGSVTSDATAGALGGLIGLDAAIANATDDADVVSTVGASSTLTLGTGGLTVTAKDTPDVSSDAIGVAVSGGISLGASVATTSVSPTVQATIGSGANLTGAKTLTLQANLDAPNSGYSGYAATAAGSGGELVGADATVSTVNANINILSQTGTNVSLPAGAVAIDATSSTKLDSTSTGVAVGGVLAVGAAVSMSDAEGSTTAQLGSYNTTGVNRTANVGVQANSTTTNTSSATAGSGGALAGSAAYAQTSDTTQTNAESGSNDTIYGDQILFNAVHTSYYFSTTNSVEASILGASGSYSKNTIDPITTTSLGDATYLRGWDSITLNAYNHIVNANNGGYSSQGAAGGVASGASVQTTTSIGDGAYVNLGTSDMLVTGTDPYANPGLIDITADDIIAVADSTYLNTGGAISAAAANSSTYVTDTDNVTIGNSTQLMSLGDLDIGTYAMDGISNSALVHTYGLAGGAGATANSEITANQTVSIGNSVDMLAFGNVNIDAGQSGDGMWFSAFGPDAIAASYVRAIIPIPVAEATATVQQNNNVTFGTGGNVYSASNIDIEAYQGETNPQADGEGHAYILGFIPVSGSDSNTSSNGIGDIQLGGNFVAGYYHDLGITIANSNSAAGLSQTSGAPISDSYYSSWNPTTFVESIPGQDPTVEELLENSISSTNVTMFDLGTLTPLFASAGNITIDATNITDIGSSTDLTAYGNAEINIINESPAYLVLGSMTTGGSISMYIPDSAGGQILFTGAANTVPSTVHLDGVDPGALPVINIDSDYSGTVGTSTIPEGPAIFITGNIQNFGGDVTIVDGEGSLGLFATILAQEWIADIPNGVLTASDPTSTYFSNSNPTSDWASYVTIPGLSSGNYDGDTAVAYVANDMFNSTGSFGSNSSGFTYSMFYENYVDNNPGSSWNTYNWYSAAVVYGSPNLYSSSYAASKSPIGGATQVNPNNNQYRDPYYYPEVPTETLTYSHPGPLSNYPSSIVSSGSQSVFIGGQVGISAKYIDIDSNISSGQSTNWSVNIPSSLNTFIQTEQTFESIFKAFGLTLPTVNLTSSAGYGLSTLNTGDEMITPVYNPAANQIVLYSKFTDPVTDQTTLSSTINASGGGFVYLNGGIISTAPGAGIHIDDGYGSVTVDNYSSAPVEVQNVDTGNGSIGEVKIVDTLASSGMPNTWWYIYQQGQGLTIYDNSNGGTTPGTATVVSSSSGDTATFNPDQVLSSSSEALEYTWSESAYLQRTVNLDYSNGNYNSNTSSDWTFLTASDGGAAGTTSNHPYANDVATGTVITGSTSDPLIKESITGGITSSTSIDYTFTYGGEGFTLPGGGGVDYGNNSGGYASINTIYPTEAWITATFTVRADNPISINFTGNSTASVTVNSASGIVLDGQIQNPGGMTTLNASSGSITEIGGVNAGVLTNSNVNILTDGLSMTAADGIGVSSSAVNATLVGGSLNASNTSSGGIYLNISSAVQINSVTADNSGGNYGNVVIEAQGSITGKSGTGTVTGDDITLNSQEGGVGTSAQPIIVSGNGVIQTSGTIIGGAVSSDALDSIYITSPDGNLFVGSIISQAGDVTLSASGAILDASAETATETLSATQLQDIWNTLHLTSDPNQGVNTVTPFDNLVDSNYQLYWKLLGEGTVNGGTYTLNSSYVSLYTPLATAVHETVTQYVQNQYNSAINFFKNPSYFIDVNGINLLGTTYSSSFAYNVQTRDSAVYNNLIANDLWNTGQLENYINVSAIQATDLPEPSSTGTLVGNAVPNVSGRNVTLTADTSVGTLAPSITIPMNELEDGTLSSNPNYQTDAAALVLANAPGQVYLDDATSQIVIDQTAPLFLSVNGTLSGIATDGPLYVQSTGSMIINNVRATGNIRIAASNSISGSGSPTGDIVGGGTLLLVAQNDNIGSAATPLTIDIPGALSADAGENIYIKQVSGGNLSIGEIFAGDSVNLNVPTGNLLALTSSSSYGFSTPGSSTLSGTSTSNGYSSGFNIVYNIVSPVINLNVPDGSVGTSTAPLQVDDGSFSPPPSTPALNGTVGTTVYLGDPNTTDTLYIGTLTSGGLQQIIAQGGLNVISTTATIGNIELAAGLDNNMGTVTAKDGNLDLTAVENLTLANGSASGSATVGSGGYMNVTTLTTGGFMTLTSGGYLDYATLTSGGYADITADGNINGVYLLTKNNSNAKITSTAGDAVLGRAYIAGDLIVNAHTTLSLTAGQVAGYTSLTSGTNMQINTLSTVGTTTLSSGGYLEFYSITSGGYAQLTAVGNIDGNLKGNVYGAALTTTGSANAKLVSTAGYVALNVADIAGAFTDQAHGTLALANSTVGTTMNLTSGSNMNLGSLKTGTAMTLTSGGYLHYTSLTAGGNVQLTAPGNIHGGNLTATSASKVSITSTGGYIVMSNTEPAGVLTATAHTTLTLATGVAASTATLTSGGNMSIGSLQTNAALTLNSGGTLGFTTLSSAGYAQLTAPGSITGGSLTTSGSFNALVKSTGGSVTLPLVHIGGALISNAFSTLSLTTGNVGSTAGLTSGSNMTVGVLNTGAGQTLSSGGALDVTTSLTANTGNIILNSSSNMQLGYLTTTAGGLTANSGGYLNLTNGTISGAGLLTSVGNMQIGTLTTGGVQTLNSGGTLGLTTLSSAGYAQLTATGNITGGSLTTTGSANALVKSTAGSITLSTAHIGGSLNANAHTSLVLTTGHIGTTDNLTSGTTMQTGTLTSGGNQTLHAGNLITINTSSALKSTSGTASLTGSGLQMNSGSSITAAGNVTLNVTGNAVLAKVSSSLTSGSALNLTVGGTISGNGDGQVNLNAPTGSLSQIQAGTGIGSSSLYLLTDVPTLTATSTTGGVYIENEESLNTSSIAATNGPLSLTVEGALDNTGTLSSGGNMNVIATTSLTGVNFNSKGTLTFQTSGTASITGTLSATGNLKGTSTGNMGLNTVSSGAYASLLSKNGSVTLSSLTASSGYIGADNRSPGNVTFTQAYIASTLHIYANNITGKVELQGGPGPLVLDPRGPGGGTAKATSVNLTIDPPQLVFSNLLAQSVQIYTDSHDVTFDNVDVPGQLSLTISSIYGAEANQAANATSDTFLFQGENISQINPATIASVTGGFMEQILSGYSADMPYFLESPVSDDVDDQIAMTSENLQNSLVTLKDMSGEYIVYPSGLEIPSLIISPRGGVNTDMAGLLR